MDPAQLAAYEAAEKLFATLVRTPVSDCSANAADPAVDALLLVCSQPRKACRLCIRNIVYSRHSVPRLSDFTYPRCTCYHLTVLAPAVFRMRSSSAGASSEHLQARCVRFSPPAFASASPQLTAPSDPPSRSPCLLYLRPPATLCFALRPPASPLPPRSPARPPATAQREQARVAASALVLSDPAWAEKAGVGSRLWDNVDQAATRYSKARRDGRSSRWVDRVALRLPYTPAYPAAAGQAAESGTCFGVEVSPKRPRR